ncbi:MAG TPA: pitrilysin family protein [Burkholderiaceae bacterium]|nr:pitrilysin family protein [Burkholderiaceae bacterium]
MPMPILLRLLSSLVVALPLFAIAAPAPVTQVEGITEVRLANGLQVLLAPDASKPTTTVNLTYRVGNRHERYGETGMAHLLEHLLFKGTPRHPTVWAEFTKRGLRANGSTWFDRTNYFGSFAANDANLDWYLDWLAESMTKSFIAKKDLDSEMTVVRNEMEMGENSPGRSLFDKTLSAAYQWHNYGNTAIGARADVENVDIGRLQAFYRLYYQPDNATLIVSGTFDPVRTMALIEKYFGRIPKPKRALPRLYTIDPVQDGERQVTLRRTGGTPQLLALYHGVPGAHPDQAAAELLTQALADAPSGRLHKRLVEGRLAAGVWSWTPTLHDPGFLAFGASLAPGQDPEAARAALLGVLEGIAAEPVTAEELERARTKWLNNWEQQFTDPEQIGVALSESVAQGDWRLFFLLRDRVRAATLADVQRFAAERLLASNRTLGVYLPTDKPQRAPAPATVDVAQQMKTFVPQAAAAAVERFDATPANIDARTQRGRLAGNASGVQYALLPKGTRGAAVAATITLRGGNLEAFAGQAEALEFLEAMLDKGTPQISRQQVQDRLDALRTTVAIGFDAAEPGALTVNLQSRREHLPAAIELVGQLLRNPSFDPAVLDELKRQATAGIEAQRKEPGAVLAEAISRHGNPYARGDIRHARSFDERLVDVRAVTSEMLRALHAKVVGAARAELAVVGDFDAAAVRAAAERAFGGFASAVPYARVPRPLVAPPPTRMQIATPDKQNANLLAVLPLAVQESDADYAPLMMANYLLGAGGNSRLWKRIRETDGLSYDVRSQIGWNFYERHSTWQASAIFAPGNRAKVEAALRQEIDRALKDGFTAKELDEGKTGLLAFRRLSRSQDENLAAGWARNLDLNRTFARAAEVDRQLQALTLDQVNGALRKYIDPARWVLGVAGDFRDQ